MKMFLRLTGIFGVILFGGFLSVTFLFQDSIERAGQVFIRYQVEKEVKEKIGSGRYQVFTEKVKSLAKKFKLDKNRLLENLKEDLPKKIVAVISSMCRLDCKNRKKLEMYIEEGIKEEIGKLDKAKQELTELIKGKYLRILNKLKKDVRIFLGCNSLMFLLVTLISFYKPQAIKHLFFPAILLLIATLISSGFYIFGQNWFFTIVYNDYIGWGYAVYLGLVFGLLLDIAFNKARVTTEIINAFLNSIGSLAHVVPC